MISNVKFIVALSGLMFFINCSSPDQTLIQSGCITGCSPEFLLPFNFRILNQDSVDVIFEDTLYHIDTMKLYYFLDDSLQDIGDAIVQTKDSVPYISAKILHSGIGNSYAQIYLNRQHSLYLQLTTKGCPCTPDINTIEPCRTLSASFRSCGSFNSFTYAEPYVDLYVVTD